MAFVTPPRVLETGSGSGTGNITLLGASGSGEYDAFNEHLSVNDKTIYVIVDGSQFEIGYGTYSSATPSNGTLTRDTVIKSSSGASKISLSGSNFNIFHDIPPEVGLIVGPDGAVTNVSAVAGSVLPKDLASLKALPEPADNTVVYLGYGATETDGLGGFFRWDDTSTATADDINVVELDSIGASAGRWIRERAFIFPGEIASDSIPTDSIARRSDTHNLISKRTDTGVKFIPEVQNVARSASYATLAALKAVASSNWKQGDLVELRGLSAEGDILTPVVGTWQAASTNTDSLDVTFVRPDDISGSNPGRFQFAYDINGPALPVGNTRAESTLTIASGAVTASRAAHVIAAESGTADDLATVTTTGFPVGSTIRIRPDAGDTITIKNGTGNITTDTGGDIILDAVTRYATLTVTSGGVNATLGGAGVTALPATALRGATSWQEGASPAVIDRSIQRIMTPEWFFDTSVKPIYCPAGETTDYSGATNWKPYIDMMADEVRNTLLDMEWPPTSTFGYSRHQMALGLQPGLRYAIDGGCDFTAIKAFVHFYGGGGSLVARYAGGAPMVDLIGCRGWTIHDLICESDNNNQPNFGILYGRASTTDEAGTMAFYNCRTEGWFDVAAMANYGSEVTAHYNLRLEQYSADAPAFWLDSRNALNIGAYSQHPSITAPNGTATVTTIQHSFFGGEIRNISDNKNGAFKITPNQANNSNTVRSVYLHNVYVTANESGTDIAPAVHIDGPVWNLNLDIHVEQQAVDAQRNLTHLLYIDSTGFGSGVPFEQVGLRIREHLSDAEIAVIDYNNANSNALRIIGFSAEIADSRGEFPAGTPAKLFGAGMAGAVIVGEITSGKVSDDFVNLDAISANSKLDVNVMGSAAFVDAIYGMEANVRSAVGDTRKQTNWRDVTAGAVTTAYADVLRLTGSPGTFTLTGSFGYYHFTVVNATGGACTIAGLAGGATLNVAANKSAEFAVYQSTIYPADTSAAVFDDTVFVQASEAWEGVATATYGNATLDGSPARPLKVWSLPDSGAPSVVAVVRVPSSKVGKTTTGVEIHYFSSTGGANAYILNVAFRNVAVGGDADTTSLQKLTNSVAQSTSPQNLQKTTITFDSPSGAHAADEIIIFEIIRNAAAGGDTATDAIEIFGIAPVFS